LHKKQYKNKKVIHFYPIFEINFKKKIKKICDFILYLYYCIMNKGIVKFFNETKGFGFIKEEGSNKEYFVHVTGLIDEIRENDVVEFELQEGKKGLNAVNVKQA